MLLCAPRFVRAGKFWIWLSSVSNFVSARGVSVSGWATTLALALVSSVISDVALLGPGGVRRGVEDDVLLLGLVCCSDSFPLCVIVDGSEEKSSGAFSLEAEEPDLLQEGELADEVDPDVSHGVVGPDGCGAEH